ncbi:hypothetical protein [Thiomicrospira microaerophila]|uniref:hypothetical protein n=1 Tax=Thiomicrospira microaerophila TaxID=406020 RepID=UPI0005C9514B|nr:hypothetical protein [Thiomicrospira microaerophila]
MKFNFSYFDVSQASGPGQMLTQWSPAQQANLYQQLIDYSKESIAYWKSQKRLVIYGRFPNTNKTDFQLPVYIPIEAEWGRFRLSAKVRFVGFVLPDNVKNTQSSKGLNFCSNTFYVVFLDKDHKFYKVEKK